MRMVSALRTANGEMITPEHIRQILGKRRGCVKLSCVLCEQRVGWRDIGQIQRMLEEDGVILCLHCRMALLSAIPKHDWYGTERRPRDVEAYV